MQLLRIPNDTPCDGLHFNLKHTLCIEPLSSFAMRSQTILGHQKFKVFFKLPNNKNEGSNKEVVNGFLRNDIIE